MVSSDRSPAGGIRVRAVRPDDVMAMGQSCYDSFTAFNQSVNIPPRLDFPNVEFARGVLKQLSSDHGGHGVIAEEESSGALMAAGFITPGDMYGIGPVWADIAFKGKGAGRAVMVALLEKAKSENAKSVRLNQIAANVISFSLYATLGFVPVECWQDLEGSVTQEQSALASRSVGISPLTGGHFRRMEDADVKECNELHIKANDFGREQEIRMAIPVNDSWVLLRDGEIIAYTLSFDLMGHSVAQTEEAFVSLFTEFCLQHPASSPLPIVHLPGRLYPRLLQWALAAKLKLRRNGWLMVIGPYQSPQHGMIYCPGIVA